MFESQEEGGVCTWIWASRFENKDWKRLSKKEQFLPRLQLKTLFIIFYQAVFLRRVLNKESETEKVLESGRLRKRRYNIRTYTTHFLDYIIKRYGRYYIVLSY